MKTSLGRIAALVALLSWSAIGCSTTAGGSPQLSGTLSPVPTPVSTKSISVCLGAMPSDWESALSKTTISLSPTVAFFATEAVDSLSQVAYGTYHVGDKFGIGGVDLGTGQLQIITSAAADAWGGVIWMTVSEPWLVWAESSGANGAWNLNGWNVPTHQELQIANSNVAAGPYTFPVVGPGYVAWSQATSTTSAVVDIYRFQTHESAVLDSGRVSSPVIAGRYLVWGKYAPGATQATFTAVDATSLLNEPLPPALAQPQQIAYLAGSPRYMVWTEDTATLDAVDLNSGVRTVYRLPQDGKHFFQFPMLAERLLVWWTGIVNTVLDLTTGNAFDVINGAAAGAGDTLVVSGAKGNVPTLSTLRLAQTTAISSCSR